MADWNYLDERIDRLTDEIEALARDTPWRIIRRVS